MGLWARLFGAATETDEQASRRLLREYEEIFAFEGDPTPGLSAAEMLSKAREGGLEPLFPVRGGGAGAKLLALADHDARARAYVDACRADGVTDWDFETWWSLHELDRRMVALADELDAAHALVVASRGLDPKEAVQEVGRTLARYAYPLTARASLGPQGDDRPLPFELKDRFNTWCQAARAGGQRVLPLPPDCTSVNAFVRALIRERKL
jgi:hypothetical protein